MGRQVLRALMLFGVLAAAAGSAAQAQTVDCRFFKVAAESLNVFADPRGDANFVGALSKNDFVCVADDQQVDDRKWAFIAYRLLPGNQRKSMDGWGIMSALQPAAAAEVAALNQSSAAPPQRAQSTMPPPAVPVARPPQAAQSAPPASAVSPAVPANSAPPTFAQTTPQVPANSAAPPAQPLPPGVPANAAPPPALAQSLPQVPGNSAPPPPSAPPSQAMTSPSAAAPPSPIQAPPPPPVYAQPPMQAPPPAPSAQAAPFDNEIVRWSQPITSGGYPVQGFSLEELVRGVPEYPPIDGLPEEVWRKTCNNCHQWNQQSLCVQAKLYAQDPTMAFRKQHPYGGPEKLAMMKWARQGCL